MFDPNKPDSILDVQYEDLSKLPSEEDDWHEYKSGLAKDKELGKKNQCCCFWFLE